MSPVNLTYPGVYVNEIDSGVHTITGVATSITAFVGHCLKGPTNEPVMITSYADFERTFGGLWLGSYLGYAVRDFYSNGGMQAVIVRVTPAAPIVSLPSSDGKTSLVLEPAPDSTWDGTLSITVTAGKSDETFNLSISGINVTTENYSDLTIKSKDAKAVDTILASESKLVRVKGSLPIAIPAITDSSHPKVLIRGKAYSQLPPPPKDMVTVTLKKTTLKEKIDSVLHLDAESQTSVTTNILGNLLLVAANEGSWGNNLEIVIYDYKNDPVSNAVDAVSNAVAAQYGLKINDLFGITLRDATTKVKLEKFDYLSIHPEAVRRIDKILANESNYIRVSGNLPDSLPFDFSKDSATNIFTFSGGVDALPDDSDTTAVIGSQANKTGIYALEKTDIFNLLYIPAYKVTDGVVNRVGNAADVDATVLQAAAKYCQNRKAFLIIDAPKDWNAVSKVDANSMIMSLADAADHAAVFFPRIQQSNPLRDNQIEEFLPGGMIAGTFARIDAQRGVWKAPAGLEARLSGIAQLSIPLTDGDNGQLNHLGVNCLRMMPAAGAVIWGARTLEGDDRLGSQWKYIPVRRLALYLEQSLYRGTQWIVFEPNDESLWRQIRLNIGSFMDTLFRQGAFQGQSAKEAYFVKCDHTTTTQDDIDRGIVNIMVGFAPLKPAEFVVIQIQQIAGQN